MSVTKLTYNRSPCPLSACLDLFGDKWTLLIIRDLMMGKSRFGHFLESPEAIPTNILATRLKRLEELEIVFRERYSDRPPRYEYRLTRRGADLLPILQAMGRWAQEHVAKILSPPDWLAGATPDSFAPCQARRQR
jgi:DNA-binding HxlR family transcriptional regulator